jgi:hypothetical protein
MRWSIAGATASTLACGAVAVPLDFDARAGRAAPGLRLAQSSAGGKLGKQEQTLSGGQQEEVAAALRKLGLSLRLNTIVSGGTTLGSTRLTHEVAHILECAGHCTKESGCTALTFANQASASTRKHSCVLFGGRPESRATSAYTSGTRF